MPGPAQGALPVLLYEPPHLQPPHTPSYPQLLSACFYFLFPSLPCRLSLLTPSFTRPSCAPSDSIPAGSSQGGGTVGLLPALS